MNLVLHGIFLRVIVWLVSFQHGSGGEPGYLDFDNLPETNFSCLGKVIGGYYADVETGCQMFHVCTIGQKDEIMDIKFLCLNGTVFDQETRVCERVDEVDCSKSERFYNLNLELYGNNAVTLSLHEVSDDEGESTESLDEQYSTTVRPTTSSTTTTTQRPTNPPATATTNLYHQQNGGYSPHYQTQPLYSTSQTSQSKSLYDDKNSGYHHQYIFHNGEQANNQATSFQLFSSQGVSSTTNPPQVHQARYGTTSTPQIIHNGPSTVAPLFHSVSSTIQTLLNSNANNPSYINPLFHNHGLASTTEHFTVHSNNPRETQEYHEDGGHSEDRRPLEAMQSTNQGKISKLRISPVPTDDDDSNEDSSHASKVSTNFLPTPTTPEPTARSFYPTPRSSQKSDSGLTQVTRHIHLSPSEPIPPLKPQQITINLPPPDIQRIVQNPSPLLPSQSRVIVTAKASVSDESGRPLNSSELVVFPLPTIPASYDDYKEGDESFDPFYRDVPKIRESRSLTFVRNMLQKVNEVNASNRRTEALRRLRREVLDDQTDYQDDEEPARDYEYPSSDDSLEDEVNRPLFTSSEETMDIATIKANLKKFRALLLGRKSLEDVSKSNEKTETFVSSDGEKETIEDMPKNVEEIVDENSGSSNNVMKTLEEDKKDNVMSASIGKEKETTEQSGSAVVLDMKKENDQSVLNGLESDTKQSTETESVQLDTESVKEPSSSMNKLEKEDDMKIIEIEEDVKEEVKPMSESEKPDVKHESVTIAKELEVKAPIESAINAKGYVESKHSVETAEVIDSEVSKDLEDKKENESTLNVSEIKLADKKTTEITDDKVKFEPEVKIDQLFSEAEHQESVNTSKDKQDDVGKITGVDSKMVENKNIIERKNVDPEAEILEVSIKTEQPDVEEKKDERKSVDSEPDENMKTKSDFTSKSLGMNEDVETQPLQPEIVSEPPQEAEEFVSHDNMKLLVTTDQYASSSAKPEVTDESTDHVMDKKVDSLVEKVKSVSETEDSFVEKELIKSMNSEEIKDSKLSITDLNKSKPIATELETSTSHSLDTKNEELNDDPSRTEQALDSSKEVDTKENTEDSLKSLKSDSKNGVNLFKFKPKSLIEKEQKKISKGITDIDDHSDARLPESKKKEGEEYPKKDETPGNASSEIVADDKKILQTALNSSESPNKIQPALIECVYSPEKHKKKSKHHHDSRSEYDDDYASEDYASKSREGDSYEMSNEEISSQELTSEYSDSGYDSAEENVSLEEDYTANSGESYSTEDSRSQISDEDYSTEGVLKFTDEIPELGKKNLRQKSKTATRTEASSEDYVDDNYEPDHYKESSLEKNDSSVESEEKKVPKDVAESFDERKLNDEALDDKITTTTTEEPTTTTTTTTTTVRPTPPSLFRPFSVRKNYKFIPPTTTPNPVVIKHRFGLLNPRPAKPIKSYNDFAPKPVIRKTPLLSRRPSYGVESTTVKLRTIERRIDDFEDSSEIVWTSKEYIDEDEKPRENILTRSANDVFLNETNEPLVNDDNDDEPVIEKKNTSDESTTSKNYLEPSIRTEKIFDLIDASLSTPYPILKATTNGNLAYRGGETTKAVQFDETTTEAVTETLIEVSTELPSTSSTTEKISNEESIKVNKTYKDEVPTVAAAFSCIDREPYRFYGDPRDCRLFHYCSPGFISRQMLDFRFVCEDTTIFDEESQSCRYDVKNPKCANRQW